MKAVQSSGPYTIMGFSAGAVIALEMAHQLQENADEVSLLVFLDGSPCFAVSDEVAAKNIAINILSSINGPTRMSGDAFNVKISNI